MLSLKTISVGSIITYHTVQKLSFTYFISKVWTWETEDDNDVEYVRETPFVTRVDCDEMNPVLSTEQSFCNLRRRFGILLEEFTEHSWIGKDS
jgi:hypothetical protein